MMDAPGIVDWRRVFSCAMACKICSWVFVGAACPCVPPNCVAGTFVLEAAGFTADAEAEATFSTGGMVLLGVP